MIVVGAHLDSVEAGPGINDNGSGSAAVCPSCLPSFSKPPFCSQPPYALALKPFVSPHRKPLSRTLLTSMTTWPTSVDQESRNPDERFLTRRK
eukprot:1761814-Rhodomonas_salina.1